MRSITTRTLTCSELRFQIQQIRDLLVDFSAEHVEVHLGLGCEVSEGEDFERQTLIRTERLPLIIEQSITKGAYQLGEADLRIKVEDKDLKILLCHESDVHVEAVDATIDAVRRRWLGHGLKGHRTECLGQLVGETKWEFWGPPGSEPETLAEHRQRLRSDSERPQYRRLRTRALAAHEVRLEVEDLCAFLGQVGVSSVDVSFGYGCTLPEQDCYRSVRMPVWHVPVHIERSVNSGVYGLGSGDLLIVNSSKQIKIAVSARAQIELQCPDLVLLEEVFLHWFEKGLSPL